MPSDADAPQMLMVWCAASSSSCGVGHVKQQAALASPCLLLAGGLGGMGSLQDDKTCQQIASLLPLWPWTMGHHMPERGGNEWISFMLAPLESPLQQSPPPSQPCWGLRGTESDTDRRAHPPPDRRPAVQYRKSHNSSHRQSQGCGIKSLK